MKKILLAIVILSVPTFAKAQTAADVLAAANAAQCEAVGLATSCTDSAHLTAWCSLKGITPCVDSRAPEEKVYATAGSYATAVLLPPKQAEVFAKRRNDVIARLVRIILSDATKCAAVMTAAGLPTDGCK